MVKDFYTLLSSVKGEDENSHIFVLSLNPDHNIYRGHFPDRAVTPGVCTLKMVKESIAKIVNCNVRFEKIANCKFTSIIAPDLGEIVIEIVLKEHFVQALVKQGGTIALKLKANWIEDDVN